MKSLRYTALAILLVVFSCSKDETPPAPTMYSLTVSAGTGGVVSTQGGSYESGSKVSITATPNAEYIFSGWSNGSTENPLTITITGNQSLQANFTKRKYALSINITGEGTVTEEVISTGKDYDSGTVVKLTAVPDSNNNWIFEGWTGAIISTDTSIQLTISEAKEVQAKFMRYFDYNKPSFYLSFSEIWINYYKILEENSINPGIYAFACPEVFADFDNDGYLDWMTAPSLYENKGGYEDHPLWFFKNQGDNETFIKTEFEINNHLGTWAARKGLLGDFNSDGKPDVIYAESSDDNWPHTGTTPTMLISGESGYTMKNLTDNKYFLHSGATGDLDNDGDLDVVLTSQHALTVFFNDGNGNFTEFPQYNEPLVSYVEVVEDKYILLPPDEHKNGWDAFELIDINNDGYLDIVAGGHETSYQSRIYYGNGVNYSYLNSEKLPYPSNWANAIDFDFYDLDNDGNLEIIVNRFKDVYEGCFVDILKLGDDGHYYSINELVDNSEAENIRWIEWFRIQDIDNNGKLDIFCNDKGHLGYGEYRWEWNGSMFEKKF